MFLMVNKSGYKQMRKIGYTRFTGTGRSLDRQIAALRAERCNVISAKVTARAPRTAGAEKAIDQLRAGDVLVLADGTRPRGACSMAWTSSSTCRACGAREGA